MANNKELKRRIRSVKNIGQITKALQMVSAVKMRKAQNALSSATPYYALMHEIFDNFVQDIDRDALLELLAQKKATKDGKKNIGLIIISPSKGFAGALLSNLTRKTIEFIERRSANTPYINDEFLIFHDEEEPIVESDGNINVKLITVEKKSKDFALKLSKDIIADFPKLSNPPAFDDIIPIADILLDEYKEGNIEEVYIVFTHFLTTFSQKAVVKKILPFDIEKKKEIKKDKDAREEIQKDTQEWYSYSEKQIAMFAAFYPQYIMTLLFHSVLDAVAAEHSARMIAMKNATDNAVDLRKQLTFEYNQKRQAAITQEIAEITSAADTI